MKRLFAFLISVFLLASTAFAYGNKELVIIPGASHTDLYDGGKNNAIPFDKLADFFAKYLK